MVTGKRVVLASNNRGKLAEMSALLGPHALDVVPVSRFCAEAPEETGDTFVANALLKARHAARVSKLPAIADDSGIEVDALGGAPGVHSARYAGDHGDDAANNSKLLSALADVADAYRTARFRCVLVFVRSEQDTHPVIADAAWEGHILRTPQGVGGFGYDPLFQPLGMTISSAELNAEEKNLRSHRGMAMRRFLQLLLVGGDL